MKGKIFSNYNRINLISKRGRNAFVGAIQAHWDKSLEAVEILRKAGIREFTNSENFPSSVLEIVDQFHIDVAELDTAYEAAFDNIDLTNVKTSSFTVRNAQSGLTFSRIRDGEKAKVYSVRGGEVTVSLNLYGGGLDWLKTWFDDGEWWTIEDNALEFRRKWYEDKAVLFYDMIQSLTNSATYNTPYDGTTNVSTALDHDRLTINEAAADLVSTLKGSGFGVTAGTPMVMLCPIQMRSRVSAALGVTSAVSNANIGYTVDYNVTPYYTAYLDYVGPGDVSGAWTGDSGTAKPLGYLCVPGRKNKIGNRMNLTLMAETDILSFAETVVGWGRYGAYMHEAQWRRVSSIA